MGGIVGGITDALGLSPERPEPIRQPSPAEQAAASKDYAIWNAALNRIDQYTPFASTVYEQVSPGSPGTPVYSSGSGLLSGALTSMMGQATPAEPPRYKQTTTLTPLGQQQLNLMSAGQQQAGALLPALGQRAQQMLTTDAGAGVVTSYGANAQTIEKAYQDYVTRGSAEINKQYDQQRQAIEQKLYNQGISAQSDAFRTALSDFEKGRAESISALQFNALQTADTRALQAATFNNQALAQQMNMRSAAVNTGQGLYAMLYNAGQASTNMSAPGYAQVQGVDYNSIMSRDLAMQSANQGMEWQANQAEALSNRAFIKDAVGVAGGLGMFGGLNLSK